MALDGYAVAPYDEDELERLRSIGVHDVEDDPAVIVEPSPGVGPRFIFQAVPEGKQVKNRVHLDLRCGDIAAEVARLITYGASVHATYDGWSTMLDPEGNEFCVCVPAG